MNNGFIENISFTKINDIINNKNNIKEYYYYCDNGNKEDNGKYILSHTEIFDYKQFFPLFISIILS